MVDNDKRAYRMTADFQIDTIREHAGKAGFLVNARLEFGSVTSDVLHNVA